MEMGQVTQNSRRRRLVLEEFTTGKVRPWGALLLLATLYFLFSASVVSAGTIRKPPTNLGLTAYWSFNDGVGTKLTDHSGNGRHGTLGAGAQRPVWTNGKLSKALSFDGVQSGSQGDIVAIPSMTVGNPALAAQNTHTVSMWIYPIPAGHGNYQTLFTQSYANGIYYHSGATKKINYYYNGGDHSSTGTLTENQWNHIAVVASGGSVTFYINGVAAGTATGALGYAADVMGNDSGDEAFMGKIDEVRVYASRALSASEVARLYQAGAAKIGRTDLSPGTLANGLVSHWTFDGRDISSSIVDRGSGGNHAYVRNTCGSVATTTTRGVLGQAFLLRDCGNYISPGDPANGSLDMGTSDFSVSFWAKFDSLPASKYLVSKGFAQERFMIYTTGAGKLRATLSDNVTTVNTAVDSPAFETNRWYHVVVTFDRGGNIVRYLNGGQSGAADSIAGVSGSISNGTDLEIGSVLAGSNMPDGALDDVRIYNRVLTVSEIKQLYRLGESTVAKTGTPSGSLQSGLVAHYTFDGKDMYNNVADVSGNGYNGMLSGQIATTTIIGKIGQALNFDGTNDYVDLGDRSVFEPSGAASFSVAFWYKGLKGSPENFLAHSPTTTNYWHINASNATFCGSTSCSTWRTNAYTLPNDNDWHHMVVVLDASTNPDSVRVYLDGVSTGTQSGTRNGGGSSWGTNTVIGGPSWVSATSYRQGPMDDVRIYNRALSASEAKQLYLLGK